MKTFRLLLLALIFGSSAAVSAPVLAQGPGLGGVAVNRFNAPVNGLGLFRGFRGGFAANSGIINYPSLHEFARTIPRPFGNSILPYYSLYPPVYYSHAIPRPYGYSPFALPPGVQPAEGLIAQVDKSQEIINPFFKPEEVEEPEAEELPKETQASNRVASTKMKVIENPYFRKADSLPAHVISNPYVAQRATK